MKSLIFLTLFIVTKKTEKFTLNAIFISFSKLRTNILFLKIEGIKHFFLWEKFDFC